MEKLMERFEDKYIPEPMSGCWIWTARVSPAGYGQASYKRKSTFAHRLAWTLFRGPIPEGLCVLHKCDNPPCVNPEHLFIGTQIENIRDCVAKGRINREAAGMARAAQRAPPFSSPPVHSSQSAFAATMRPWPTSTPPWSGLVQCSACSSRCLPRSRRGVQFPG